MSALLLRSRLGRCVLSSCGGYLGQHVMTFILYCVYSSPRFLSVRGHPKPLAIPHVSGRDVPGRISHLRRLKLSVSKIQSPTKPLVKKSLSNPKLTCCSAFSSSFHFSNISRSSSMPWCSADSRFLCDEATRTIILLLIKLIYFNKAHIQKHHLRYAAGYPIPSVKEAWDLPETGL